MSIEQKIDALTNAMVALTNAIQNNMPGQAAAPQMTAQVPQAPQTAPAFAATAPQMPAAPFGAPSAAHQVPALPFNDPASLNNYVAQKYQHLEAKQVGLGHSIQNVLTSLGVQQMSDVQPHQYHAFYQGVEALG